MVNQILEYIPTIDYTTTSTEVSLFETTIRYLGGMLSAYDLLKGPLSDLASNVSLSRASRASKSISTDITRSPRKSTLCLTNPRFWPTHSSTPLTRHQAFRTTTSTSPLRATTAPRRTAWPPLVRWCSSGRVCPTFWMTTSTPACRRRLNRTCSAPRRRGTSLGPVLSAATFPLPMAVLLMPRAAGLAELTLSTSI